MLYTKCFVFLFSLLLLIQASQANLLKDFFLLRRTEKMVSTRTVFLSSNRTCSSSPANVLLTEVSYTEESCLAKCVETSGCLAFSFLTMIDSSSQCVLFHSCSSLEPCCSAPACQGCRTGLLPGLRADTNQEEDRTTRRLSKQLQREKGPRALRLEGGDPYSRDQSEEAVMIPSDYPCQRIIRRSCQFSLDSVITILSSISFTSCLDSCKTTLGCSHFTYHWQGGGGIHTSSPCVLFRRCEKTVWCEGCVSAGPTLCQQKKQSTTDITEKKSAVIIAGGYSLDFVDHVEMFSASGSCATVLPDMPLPKTRGVAQYMAGQLLVCGGRSREAMYTRSCAGLDLRTGVWEDKGEMKKGREDASSILVGGKMVVLGGWNGEELLDCVEIYDSQQDMWQEVPGWRLSQSRYQHCSASLGSLVVVAGGYPTMRGVEMLRLGGEEWTGWEALEDMRAGRIAHACTLTAMGEARVLIISGGQNGGEFLSSVEYLHLDKEEATWLDLSPMLLPRRNHAMLEINHSLLIVGGDTSSFTEGVGFSYQLVGQVEQLNLNGSNNWTLTDQILETPRSVMEALVVDGEFC